jgi:hypothetical protein
MLTEPLRGSFVAFGLFVLSAFCAFAKLLPVPYFAVALIIWIAYSCYRLLRLIFGARTTPWTEQSKREQLVYWITAIITSLATPLGWGLILSNIRQFP